MTLISFNTASETLLIHSSKKIELIKLVQNPSIVISEVTPGFVLTKKYDNNKKYKKINKID